MKRFLEAHGKIAKAKKWLVLGVDGERKYANTDELSDSWWTNAVYCTDGFEIRVKNAMDNTATMYVIRKDNAVYPSHGYINVRIDELLCIDPAMPDLLHLMGFSMAEIFSMLFGYANEPIAVPKKTLVRLVELVGILEKRPARSTISRLAMLVRSEIVPCIK